jgi:hypothetical protein
MNKKEMSALFGFNADDRKQYHYILDNIMSTVEITESL